MRRKEATVSYYVDADVLGLAKILVQVRRDATYPGDPGGTGEGRPLPSSLPDSDPGHSGLPGGTSLASGPALRLGIVAVLLPFHNRMRKLWEV